MIRGFYYSEDFDGDVHFAISVRDNCVGRWPNYERAKNGDTVILWTNASLIMGKITGDGTRDNTTWTGGSFVAYPVEWTNTTPKRTKDVFLKKERIEAWNAISNQQEGSVQKILQKVVNQCRPKRGPLDGFFGA